MTQCLSSFGACFKKFLDLQNSSAIDLSNIDDKNYSSNIEYNEVLLNLKDELNKIALHSGLYAHIVIEDNLLGIQFYNVKDCNYKYNKENLEDIYNSFSELVVEQTPVACFNVIHAKNIVDTTYDDYIKHNQWFYIIQVKDFAKKIMEANDYIVLQLGLLNKLRKVITASTESKQSEQLNCV